MLDWSLIPAELRERAQWCVSPGLDDDKAPRSVDGHLASSTNPSTWSSFDAACRVAAERGWHVGYMLLESDPFACIDLDVKDATPDAHVQGYQRIIADADSYTERSRSGRGWHVFVRGAIGKGRRRDGVEVYSQERFIICTGNVVRDQPIVERQALLNRMVAKMAPETPVEIELTGDDVADFAAAARAADDTGELGRLFRGEWQGRYESQSDADLALAKLLLPITESPRECWQTFRLSRLGARDKAKRGDYARRTMAVAMQHHASDMAGVQHGRTMADGLLWTEQAPDTEASLLDRMSIDWTGEDEADVPDIVEGLVADEEVTLLGGHGGVGKGFLALQMACAVALGEAVLNCPTRQSRVLYYSAEDGKKRLTRRLRRVAELFDYDAALLRKNLRVLDASEIEPLYGERLEPTPDGRRFNKMLGASVDFDNLRHMVEMFDPQLVVIDGASDTFDGNEIARREVRAFIKMLRRVHPHRNVGVLLIVHIDRSSARGYSTNDDGYAGSAQWHNSCRRRVFIQHQIKKERGEDGEETIVDEKFVLRVMKNQDGPSMPDMELQRGEWGLWQTGVHIGGELAPGGAPDHTLTLVRLISEYYARGHYMSTSLAPQSTNGVYATLKGDPTFPKGLTKKRTTELVRNLKRDGVLVEEDYKRTNRSPGERWMVTRDPNEPFVEGARSAQSGTG